MNLCGGCTDCCDNFAMTTQVVDEVNRQRPGMLSIRRKLTDTGVIVHCNRVIPGVGCMDYPKKGEVDMRQNFCRVPDPRECNRE